MLTHAPATTAPPDGSAAEPVAPPAGQVLRLLQVVADQRTVTAAGNRRPVDLPEVAVASSRRRRSTEMERRALAAWEVSRREAMAALPWHVRLAVRLGLLRLEAEGAGRRFARRARGGSAE